jgi:carbon storage regulator CsrA
MLVLTRKLQETIVITTPENRRIEIVVLRMGGNKARVGITADADVNVQRKEVETRQAAA